MTYEMLVQLAILAYVAWIASAVVRGVGEARRERKVDLYGG